MAVARKKKWKKGISKGEASDSILGAKIHSSTTSPAADITFVIGHSTTRKQMRKSENSFGITRDGRCLFRSVIHGMYHRNGKQSLSEALQKQLADELRLKVVDEFVKRRSEAEWYVEGDFEKYVAEMRKPHVWGGEPELLMCSHVLQIPIEVYMKVGNSRSLKVIAEYGREYGHRARDPIHVLYDGHGHYDAL